MTRDYIIHMVARESVQSPCLQENRYGNRRRNGGKVTVERQIFRLPKAQEEDAYKGYNAALLAFRDALDARLPEKGVTLGRARAVALRMTGVAS